MPTGPADDHPDRHLDRHFERLQNWLHPRVAAPVARLRQPHLRWLRLPLGVALIAGGFLGFLPVLGFWMLPLGILLLAHDIPFLKRPTARALDWCHRRWDAFRRRRADRP
ncbi:MAG: hypothetical protein WAS73_05155 [Defluviicoccus sp.]